MGDLNIKDIVIPEAPEVEGFIKDADFNSAFNLKALLDVIFEFIRNLIKFEF